MTLWVSPSNLWINCQHLPCSTSSPPCTPSFSHYQGPDPARLTPVCELNALLGPHMQMTLQKGQCCRTRCLVQIQTNLFKWPRKFFPGHANLSSLALLGDKGTFSLFLLLMKYFVLSCQSESLVSHKKISWHIFSRVIFSPRPNTTLLFGPLFATVQLWPLKKGMPVFMYCTSSCTFAVMNNKKQLACNKVFGTPPQDLLLRIQLLSYFCDMSVMHDHRAIKAKIIRKKRGKFAEKTQHLKSWHYKGIFWYIIQINFIQKEKKVLNCTT